MRRNSRPESELHATIFFPAYFITARPQYSTSAHQVTHAGLFAFEAFQRPVSEIR